MRAGHLRIFIWSFLDLTAFSAGVRARLFARVNFLRRSKGLAFLSL